MVETEDDDSALARVCACNAAGEVLMDRPFVKPDGVITDPRTAITGIDTGNDRGKWVGAIDISIDQLARAKVMVGHTFHRDLASLRMDALLVFDISLLQPGFEMAFRWLFDGLRWAVGQLPLRG
eukprot:Skav228073  [mRNA]  locus=scaffold5285:8322:11656:- [translate_table: standard]